MSEPRCWVKTYEAMCRLPIDELHTPVAELEARRQPVPERSRLTVPDLNAIPDDSGDARMDESSDLSI